MQLKRILARDSRSATDQAIALYGSDVLIISNHLVNGQTELVVALDLPAADDSAGGLPLGMTAQASPSHPRPDLLLDASALRTGQGPASPGAASNFRNTLLEAQSQASGLGKKPAEASRPADARDYLRSREIVDLVRDELAALRREFRLSQHSSGWMSNLALSPTVQPLAHALGEAAIPQELRALLLDILKDHNTAEDALQALKAQLIHSLARPALDVPSQGVHLLAGPSGAGKTLMVARLARLSGQIHGSGQVAVISYMDERAGAWSQTQMLAAQLGVDCYRVADADTLALLLNEIMPRRLVLIDTPGVQMQERVAEVLRVQPDCSCHAVIPADASTATLSRLTTSAIEWRSLLVSKVDECTQPWPLLHFLSNNLLPLAGASEGAGPADLLKNFPIQQLVALGLAQLQASCPSVQAEAADSLAAPQLQTSRAMQVATAASALPGWPARWTPLRHPQLDAQAA